MNVSIPKILLFGADGQVGKAIQVEAKQHSLEVVPLTRKDTDITDLNRLHQIFALYQPDVVINAAAYTAVDKAEEESTSAFEINAKAVGYLAECCKKHNCILVHFSTDYVFDGSKRVPYTETDLPAPINIYGQSKLEGERLIQSILHKYFIFRVSWVFSSQGNNFVKTILRLAATRESLDVVSDQHGCPTAAASIASVIMKILTRNAFKPNDYGIYHYCDEGAATWFEFAQNIIKNSPTKHICKTINPILSSDYPTSATRPLNSILNCHKIETVFGIRRFQWQKQLQSVLSELSSHDIST